MSESITRPLSTSSTAKEPNKAEDFFSQLKRSIDGTHRHVSAEHLPRYLAEFDYRCSTRKMSDGDRMERFMAATVGRRLTYKRITE